MQRNKKRIVVAVLAICALAAGGAAFTADVTGVPSNQVAGFHQTQISGGVANNLTYHLSSDGQYIQSVTMDLTSDGTTALPANSVVDAGFDQGSGDATLVTCTNTSGNSFSCDYTNGGTGNGVAVENTSVFNVSISDSTHSTGVPGT